MRVDVQLLGLRANVKPEYLVQWRYLLWCITNSDFAADELCNYDVRLIIIPRSFIQMVLYSGVV